MSDDAAVPLGHGNRRTAKAYIEGSRKSGNSVAQRLQLLDLAEEAFDAIEANTGTSYWQRNYDDTKGSLAAALDAFDSLIVSKGIGWIVDSAVPTGLAHLGLMAWIDSARTLTK